jgi:hypothetical protein
MLSIDEYWSKRSLILGEVNSGKTQMTLRLLASIMDQKGQEEVAVLDFAPEKNRSIGGKMQVPSHPLMSYLTTTIVPPRLTGKNHAEVEAHARRNAEMIENLFSAYLKNPKKVLVINDVTLYLQQGSLSRLVGVFTPSHTVLINGYYGTTFGDTPFSQKERAQVDRLVRVCDRVIYL